MVTVLPFPFEKGEQPKTVPYLSASEARCKIATPLPAAFCASPIGLCHLLLCNSGEYSGGKGKIGYLDGAVPWYYASTVSIPRLVSPRRSPLVHSRH